jgi:hypothetical protein
MRTLSQYKSYSWGKIQTANGLWDDRVKSAVASQLAAKGWTEVASGGDVVIAARDAIQNQQQLNTFYDGFGREPEPQWSESKMEKWLPGARIIKILRPFGIEASIWDEPIVETRF